MAMIRIELENKRRRLPVILAALGLTAIAVSLYGLDQQIGLLRLLRFDAQPAAQSEVTAPEPTLHAVAQIQRSSEGSSASGTQGTDRHEQQVEEPAGTDHVAQQRISTQESTILSAVPMTWWQTAYQLRQHLPAAVQVSRLESSADGSFELQGLAASSQHEALQQTVAAMRDAGWQTHLTFWREQTGQPSAYLIRGAADSDAPTVPPEHRMIDVDALVQLAQRHVQAAGLTRLARLRPTHEDWTTGGTRIEQVISAVGSPEQAMVFGAALAGEDQARLTRFDIESTGKGLVRATASLDVLLRKESGR